MYLYIIYLSLYVYVYILDICESYENTHIFTAIELPSE